MLLGVQRVAQRQLNLALRGGQGEMVAAAVAALGLEPAVAVTSIGVTGLPECGTNDEVLAHHKLDVASLVKSMRYVVPQIA